jgi:hypothetical protein
MIRPMACTTEGRVNQTNGALSYRFTVHCTLVHSNVYPRKKDPLLKKLFFPEFQYLEFRPRHLFILRGWLLFGFV